MFWSFISDITNNETTKRPKDFITDPVPHIKEISIFKLTNYWTIPLHMASLLQILLFHHVTRRNSQEGCSMNNKMAYLGKHHRSNNKCRICNTNNNMRDGKYSKKTNVTRIGLAIVVHYSTLTHFQTFEFFPAPVQNYVPGMIKISQKLFF